MNATMELPATKKCTKCGEVKGFWEFHKQNKGLNGRTSRCADCSNKANAKWRSQNQEKIKNSILRRNGGRAESKKNWAKNNPEKIKTYNAKWRKLRNQDAEKARYAKYYRENKANILYKKADWYARQKAMRQFFKMHRAMHAIAETLNQTKP